LSNFTLKHVNLETMLIKLELHICHRKMLNYEQYCLRLSWRLLHIVHRE